MRGLGMLTVVLAKLYARDPLSLFFTLIFAPLLTVLLGVVFGTDLLEVNLPAYAAIVVGIMGVLGVPIGLVEKRQTGVLRRLRVTPLRPLVYIAADVTVSFVVVMLGVVMVVLVGAVGFGVHAQGSVAGMLLAAALGALAFMALGYVLAGIVPSVSAAQVLGNVLIIPLLFLSGATVPLEVMPEAVQAIARYSPLTQVVTLMRGVWIGDPWTGFSTQIGLLVGQCLLGVAIASWIFRWE